MDFRLPITQFQEKINKNFSEFAYPKVKIVNNCLSKNGLELSQSQKFISKYFTEKNPNGLLLYHTVGSGKTLTAVKLLSEFEKKGFNTLWITRTTLKKDLDKALNMVPLKKLLKVFSYKQFSNICKRKGENYRILLDRAKKIKNTDDPFYKTVIIIDEAHKLYTKDLKSQELHDINVIQKLIYESYDKSKENRCRVVLMSATPITEDATEVIKLLNLIIVESRNRFNLKNFANDFLDRTGKFKESMKGEFKEKIKGLVSYLDISGDPSKFAQAEYKTILVPVSQVETAVNCEINYARCSEYGVFNCHYLMNECKKINKEIKTNSKKTQEYIFKDKCNIDIKSIN